jgi:hypothetical protein
MPAKAEWLLRLPEIRAALERFDAPVVDRSVIEELFGLRRRRAIVLMHQLGGYQAGRTFLVDRLRLLGRLAASEDGGADSGRSGALIPFEVGQRSARMWGKIPLGSGALFRL